MIDLHIASPVMWGKDTRYYIYNLVRLPNKELAWKFKIMSQSTLSEVVERGIFVAKEDFTLRDRPNLKGCNVGSAGLREYKEGDL